jgi:hypothetical protein
MVSTSVVLGRSPRNSSVTVNRLLERGLPRTSAVVVTWLSTVVINFVIFAVAATAGVTFSVEDGSVWSTMGLGVMVVTTALLLPGLILAALLSLRWNSIIRVAQYAGSAFAILTIGLTYAAGFDSASAGVLASMHIVVVPVFVLGLELIRNRDTWTRY